MVIQARLAAVGELAAGVAHELNNPLAFIRTNLGLLDGHVKSLSADSKPDGDERQELAEELGELIQETVAGVERVTQVVQGVRRFTDAARSHREPANLNDLVEDTLAMMRLQSRSSERTIAFCGGELPLISCAPSDLRQVLLNILVNATESVNEGGRITIETRVDEGSVIAEIADDGPGMPPEVLACIFDPFYTTKRVGHGMGLGLTIAWHIVEAHGGRIDVASTPGAGSTFRVRLPL